MKRLFLFVTALTLSLTSCSSDDDKGGNENENGNVENSELRVTIDGVQKTFNTIVVNEEHYEEEHWASDLEITATIDNNPSEMIILSLEEGSLGASAIWGFWYTKSGTTYSNGYSSSEESTSISSVISTNSNKKIKGTFEAVLASGFDENGNLIKVVLTDGSFDISY